MLIIDRRLSACLDVAFSTSWRKKILHINIQKFSSTVRYHQSYPHIFAYREVLPNSVDGMKGHWPLSLKRLNAHSEKQPLLSDNLSFAIRDIVAKLYPIVYRSEWPLNPSLRDDFQVNDTYLSVASSNNIVLYSASWFRAKQTDYGFEYGYAISHSEILEDNISVHCLWQKEILIASRCLESQFGRLARALAHHFDSNHYSIILNQIKK